MFCFVNVNDHHVVFCYFVVEAQIAASLAVTGGWIDCMIGSYPAEKYGRKRTLLANNLFFIAGVVPLFRLTV